MDHAVFVKVHQALDSFSIRKEGWVPDGTHLENLIDEIANFSSVFERRVVDGS